MWRGSDSGFVLIRLSICQRSKTLGPNTLLIGGPKSRTAPPVLCLCSIRQYRCYPSCCLSPRQVNLLSDLNANPTALEQVCREGLHFLRNNHQPFMNRHSQPASRPIPLLLLEPASPQS